MGSFQFATFRKAPLWGMIVTVGSLSLATFVTYQTGGTANVFPHLFYIPTVFAAVMYGISGGLLTGLVSGILCGPLMPQFVQLGIPQTVENWMVRLLFFAVIGVTTGGLTRSLRLRIDALKNLNEQTILAFVQAIDAKDPYTGQHSMRVAHYAENVAKVLGLSPAHMQRVKRAALLHDIGKISVPGYILNKPSRLTAEEFDIIKRHPAESAKIISGIDAYKQYIPGIRDHHERIDGRGYPEGKRGRDIPLDARIIAVADAFEAMTSHRPYRPKLPQEEAVRRLKEGAGSQFDPQVVKAMIQFLNSTDDNPS